MRPFLRDVLFTSIYESCRHRPTATQDAAQITQTIIASLLPNVASGVVERDVIVIASTAVLDRFDPAAATMYKAYHPIQQQPSKC